VTVTELLVWGVVVHLVVDWLTQSSWTAEHKTNLRHPAGYLHAALHGVALLLVFPPLAAAALAVAHLVIDTRVPLDWWARVVSRPAEGPMAATVHVWRDQTLHIATIAAAALIVA
jgi:hypothetical protein